MATITPKNGDILAGVAGQSSDIIDAPGELWFTGDHPYPASFPYPVRADAVIPARTPVGFDAGGYIVPATYSAVANAAASGALTFADVGNDGDTITIGGTVYTMRTAPDAAGEVLIGASVTESARNLKEAINGNADYEGIYFGEGTTSDPAVSATSALGVVTVTARAGGTAGNSIATTETSSEASWGAATLTGGAGATTGVKAIGITEYAVDNTGGADGALNAAVWRQGVFNPNLVQWDDSFDTAAKKYAAFEGAPTPTAIFMVKPTAFTTL